MGSRISGLASGTISISYIVFFEKSAIPLSKHQRSEFGVKNWVRVKKYSCYRPSVRSGCEILAEY